MFRVSSLWICWKNCVLVLSGIPLRAEKFGMPAAGFCMSRIDVEVPGKWLRSNRIQQSSTRKFETLLRLANNCKVASQQNKKRREEIEESNNKTNKN